MSSRAHAVGRLPEHASTMDARRTASYAVGLALSFGLTGCGDPPPDPRDAPIEVVLDSCTLNRGSVQVGTHEVSVIGEGLATFKDPQGNGVFQVDAAGRDPEGYRLSEGRWTVECQAPSGAARRATLQVDPAS